MKNVRRINSDCHGFLLLIFKYLLGRNREKRESKNWSNILYNRHQRENTRLAVETCWLNKEFLVYSKRNPAFQDEGNAWEIDARKESQRRKNSIIWETSSFHKEKSRVLNVLFYNQQSLHLFSVLYFHYLSLSLH